MLCCDDGLAEHGWPVIGALNLLTTMMKREVYDGRPPLAEQFHKHGDIFRLKLPGKFASEGAKDESN